MPKQKMLWAFGLVVILFLGLQALMVFADSCEGASETALNFTKAYFGLDPDMANMVCQEVKESAEADPVATFMNQVALEAENLGHSFNYMRSQLTKYHLETIAQDDKSATIHISGKRKRSIHPIFTYVGRLFFLGETYDFEKTLNLVKEEGEWKVCDDLFNATDVWRIYEG